MTAESGQSQREKFDKVVADYLRSTDRSEWLGSHPELAGQLQDFMSDQQSSDLAETAMLALL